MTNLLMFDKMLIVSVTIFSKGSRPWCTIPGTSFLYLRFRNFCTGSHDLALSSRWHPKDRRITNIMN